MIEIRRTEAFITWFNALRDARAFAKIAVRIKRLADGNIGDAASVGDGVSELRIHFGPGYRVYFTRRGKTIVVLLCGGDKSTQAADIAKAKALAKEC
jgi:putative addiction module killer protein